MPDTENGITEIARHGKWLKIHTLENGGKYMAEWKMHNTENDGKFTYWKMAENT